MNRETAITEAGLNRVDQFTPQGSLTWTQNGTWADGTPRFQQTMQYAPEQQALYDQQNQIAQALGGTAQNALGRADATMSQGLSFDGFQPLQGVNPQATPQLQTSLGQSGPLTTGVQQSQFQDQIANAGGIQSTFGTGGPLTNNVQQSQFQDQIAGAGDVTRQAGGDFNETSRAASDAVFNQLSSRLNPQFQQLESDMRNRLINSGISENSEAFRREMDNFGRQRTDAFNTAGNQSVLTGLQAQQQGFGQSMANAQLNNQAQGQIFGQNAAQLDAFNNARANEFNQGMMNAGLNNQAQGQQFQQNMGAAAFGNQAQAQQFGQNAAQLDVFNNARANEFSQGAVNAGINNQAQGQQFDQNLAAGQFGNTSRMAQDSMDWNRQLQSAGFNNDVRQRQIEEAAYLRNLPLNDIAALLGTGGGVQAPSFGPVSQVGVSSPDLMGATYNTYNAQMQQWQQQQQARSQGLGSIFGLAGTIGSAFISDRRMKESIRKVGELANGIATYSFKYIGDAITRFGVMAQEVLDVVPDAVGTLPDGTLYVDYRKVGL